MPKIEPSNVIGGAEGGLSGISYVDVQLTDTQIKALPTTYIEVVPAPGAGLVLHILGGYLLTTFSGGSYSNLDAVPRLYLVYGDWEADASAGIQFTGQIGPQTSPIGPPVSQEAGNALNFSQAVDVGPLTNAAIKVASNNGSDYQGGNAANVLSFRIWYAIVPATPFGA